MLIWTLSLDIIIKFISKRKFGKRVIKMVAHLTVRMAWHDKEWNGTICRNPRENIYCVGSYSLLSERISRERNVDIEEKHHTEKIDALLPEYLPPVSGLLTHSLRNQPKSSMFTPIKTCMIKTSGLEISKKNSHLTRFSRGLFG